MNVETLGWTLRLHLSWWVHALGGVERDRHLEQSLNHIERFLSYLEWFLNYPERFSATSLLHRDVASPSLGWATRTNPEDGGRRRRKEDEEKEEDEDEEKESPRAPAGNSHEA